MSTAITPPTPENVAEMLTSGDNDYHDGNDWWPSLSRDGNVVKIGIEPVGQDYETKLPEVHFRAVVVPGETVPDLAEADRLKGRLDAAEAIMRQCLAAVGHAEVLHLLGLYFSAVEAAQAVQNGGAS